MGEFRFVGLDALYERAMTELQLSVRESLAELKPKVQKGTPTDTKALLKTEHRTPVRRGRFLVEGQIVTGEGLSYAIIVHQKPEIHHDRGSAKFVTYPLIAHRERHRELVRLAGKRAF